MSNKAKPSFNPRRFRTNVPFYARYRLHYPQSLIAKVIAETTLGRGDRVMDLGCGPGLLAIPFAQWGMAVTAVDPEPEMIEAAGLAASAQGIRLDLRIASSYSLPSDLEPFRLVTMGRSFHWMDREATLAELDRIVTSAGALVFFDDEHPVTAENAWHRKLREVGERFGRSNSPHLQQAQSLGFRSHHALLLDSPFRRLRGLTEYVRRDLTIDDVVGLAFSLSTSSPEKLGDQRAAFEAELRAELLALSPNGRFAEIAELSALVASRD